MASLQKARTSSYTVKLFNKLISKMLFSLKAYYPFYYFFSETVDCKLGYIFFLSLIEIFNAFRISENIC